MKQDNNNIDSETKIPQNIIEAANNGKLVVFIGAGVSRVVGCKGWDDLANSLLIACYDEGLVNYKEKELLTHQVKNNKELITIAHKLLLENEKEEKFYEKFDKALEPQKTDLEKYNIYKELIGFNALFISTNADTIFEDETNIKKFFQSNEITTYTLNQYNTNREPMLFKIHGCKNDRNSLVFTLEQYLRKYKAKDFKKFLNEIFSQYVVLFVGYGLAEMELLDFLFTKINGTSELKHYYLMPFFREEGNILNIRKSYYETMGIKVIPYFLDNYGFKELYNVIKEWKENINTSFYQIDNLNLITEAILTPKKKKITQVLKLIKADANFRDILFKKISNSSNPLPWFSRLHAAGFFSPKHNTRPMLDSDGKFYATPLQWWALYALENIAKHNTNGVQAIIDKIIKHELKVTGRKNNPIKPNYDTNVTLIRTISYFNEISDLHINFIVNNICSSNDRDYVTHIVITYIIPNLLKARDKDNIVKIFNKFFETDRYDFKIASYDYEKLMETSYKELKDLFKTGLISYLIEKIEILIQNTYFAFDINKVKKVINQYDNNIQQLVSNNLFNLLTDLKPKKLINVLLNKKHDFFIRLALNFIDQNYNLYKSYLWDWLENNNPFNNHYEELFILFRNHYTDMDSKQITKIITLLNSADYSHWKDEEEAMFVKKQWLVDLFNGVPQLAESFMESLKKYDSTIPSPRDFELKFDIAVPINKKQMLPTEQFIKLSIYDILLQINNKDYDYRDNLALANNLKEAIKNKPTYFINNLEKFLGIDFYFISEIFSVLTEIWQYNIPPFKQITFSWQKVFHFINRVLRKIDFNKINDNHYQSWALTNILRLLTSGMIKDDHAFEVDYFKTAENIFLKMSEYKEIDDLSDDTKIVFYAINTFRKKLYMAMIDYSLRNARCQTTDTKHWVESIKLFFIERLNAGDLIAHFVFGSCMPNLLYLDEKWLKNNYCLIFCKTNDKLWEWSFMGYCYGRQLLYWPIYDLLSEDYSRSLTFNFKEKEYLRIVIEHILKDYLLRENDLKFNEVLAVKNLQFIDTIIAIINTWKENDKEGIITDDKVLHLLKKIDELLKDKPSGYQETCSNLCSWIFLLDIIDEKIIDCFEFSLRNMKNDWHSEKIIEGLLKHINQYPNEVVRVFNTMLDASVYPKYDNEKIVKLVSIMYDKGFTDQANGICSKFIKVGRTFLQETFNKYQGR